MKQTLQTIQYTMDFADRAKQFMNIAQADIFVTVKAFNAAVLAEGGHRKIQDCTRYGATKKLHGKYFVFISLKNHDSIKVLNDTIVHELYHCQDWEAEHGKSFDRTVQRITSQLFDYGTDAKGELIQYKGEQYD